MYDTNYIAKLNTESQYIAEPTRRSINQHWPKTLSQHWPSPHRMSQICLQLREFTVEKDLLI